MPPTLAALVTYGKELKSAVGSLQGALDSLAEATRQFAGALVAVMAIAGIADAMDDTFQFHTVGSVAPDPTAGSPIKILRQRADALASAFQNKTGGDPDPRRFVPELDSAVHASTTAVLNLLRDPASLKIVQAFCDDPAVDDKMAYINLWALGQIVALALDLLARTEAGDEALEMATEVLEQHDEKHSVPAIALAKGRTSWSGFVAACAVATGTVGNLPGGTDSFSIALLKIYAAHRLPKAALSKSLADGLEGDLFSMIVDAIQLSDVQKATLKGLTDDLKKAQAEVIRRAKQEAVATANVPDYPPRAVRATRRTLERKTGERLLAEEDCKAKAEKISSFYEDTYGPENQHIFGPMQRGAFMDGFITTLMIIQLLAAFQEIDDPHVSAFQKLGDIGLPAVLTLGAVVSTVGRHLDVGIAKIDIAALGMVLESRTATKVFGAFAGAMAVISGGAQVATGFKDDDLKEIFVGLGNTVSGALIAYGTLAASSSATGFGVGIGVLLGLYGAWTALADAAKNETEKAIDSLIDSLEKNKVFTSQTAVQHLGLDSELEDVKHAVPGGCSQLLRNPHGDPTREALIANMQSLGFDTADATSLVESADDEAIRLNPFLAPPPVVPTP